MALGDVLTCGVTLRRAPRRPPRAGGRRARPAGGAGPAGRGPRSGDASRRSREVLGPHAQFTVRPVLRPGGAGAGRCLRGAAATSAGRAPDDAGRHHPVLLLYLTGDAGRPHRPPDGDGQSRSGPSAVGNYGPMTIAHHRVQTHGRWQVPQPFPGICVWRDPHGAFYLVDHTGTRRVPERTRATRTPRSPGARSPRSTSARSRSTSCSPPDHRHAGRGRCSERGQQRAPASSTAKCAVAGHADDSPTERERRGPTAPAGTRRHPFRGQWRCGRARRPRSLDEAVGIGNRSRRHRPRPVAMFDWWGRRRACRGR